MIGSLVFIHNCSLNRGEFVFCDNKSPGYEFVNRCLDLLLFFLGPVGQLLELCTKSSFAGDFIVS